MQGWDGYRKADIARMNVRFDYIVAPFQKQIKAARVLDIAAHDGRWSYALASAGAAEVYAVEARAVLIQKYSNFPETDFKHRVTFKHSDLYKELDRLIDQQATFDVVALFGILYHVTDHYGLLARIKLLQPKVIIIDSEFITKDNPMIQLARERTDNVLNATGQVPEQHETLIGIPSTGAIERMASVLNYQLVWSDWDALPQENRRGLRDYFRNTPKRRRTCALYPLETADQSHAK
ncbi:MAG: class I SAM-dependent methyltransferase [Planktotalea sp.]|uniref:class I SAM-dependent methyltransferase n=1 Tax=Planktotalea sp. TaxID=2029877 RepID=UPI003C7243C8